MANERQVDLILRSQVDQALQPLAQVTQRIKDLIAVLDQQRNAAKTGDTTLGEYAKALRDVEKASADLLKQRAALDNFATRGEKVDAQQAVVTQRQQRRDAFASGLSAEPTERESAALDRLNRALTTSQTRLDNANIAYQKATDQLQRLGVITDETVTREQRLAALDPAHNLISSYALLSTEALKAGQAQNDTLLVTLRAANLEKQIASQRATDAARNIANQEKERQATIAAADAIRAKGAAAQQQATGAAFTGAVQAGRGISQADIEAAFASADADAKAIADAERKGQTIARINAGLAAQSQAERDRVAQEEDAATAKAIADAERKGQTIARINAGLADQAEAIAARQVEAEEAATAKALADAERKGQTISRANAGLAAQAETTAVREAEAAEMAATRAIAAEEKKARIIRQFNLGILAEVEQQNAARAKLDDAAATARAAQATRGAAIEGSPLAAPPGAVASVGAVTGITRDGAQSISDTAAAVAKLDASMGKGSLTAQSYNRAMDTVFAIQRQIASDAGLIDALRKQDAAMDLAATANNKAEAEVRRLIAALKTETADLNELARAEKNAEVTSANLQRQVVQHAALDAQLKARKIDTAALDAETNKLVGTMQRLSDVQGRAQQGGAKIFGLTTYQAQNLSFQINDVVTQLSLGQGFLRTFESQAGQIFQIFETSISAMQRMVLYGAPAAAVIGTIVLALLRLKETGDAQREFSRLLAANVDGLAYQAKQLTITARAIEGFGVSFDDARSAVKTFMRDGLSTDSMLEFARTAHNLAEVTGIDFADALKAVSAIAHGSFADIAKLNDEYGFLHDSELVAIKDAFDYGNAETGRTIAIDAATRAFQRGRDQGVDPLHQGMQNLTAAWHEFLDAIGSTQLLTALVLALTNITKLANETAMAIRYILNPTQAEANNKVMLLQAALKATHDEIDRITSGGVPENDSLSVLQGRARELTRLLGEAIVSRDKLATGGVTVPPGSLGPNGSEVTSGLTGRLSSLPQPDSRVNKPIPGDIQATIDAVAATIGISVADLQALYRNEASRNADGSFNTSSAGARGPFQVLPGTFDETVRKFQTLFDALSTTLGKRISIDDPDFNALAGGLYYKQQLKDFGNNRLLAAGAYNAGPAGLRSMLAGGGSDQGVKETSQYIANFTATPGVNTPLPGAQRNPNLANQDAARQQAASEMLQQQLTATVDETLRGDARLLSDQQRLTEFYKQKNNELDAKLQGAPRSPEVTKAFNDVIDQFAKKLENERTRQEDAATNAALQIIKSAQETVDRANKTDPAAARRVVDAQFDKQISALNEAIARGAADIAGQSVAAARDALLKVRDQAREQATIAADRAIVDDTVKARDLQVSAVEADLKSGAITLEAAFDRIALIVKTFGPQIQTAVDRSNTDLSRQPQTPAIQEQLAKNQAVDVSGRRAAAGVDETSMKQILDTQKSRNDLVASYNELVHVGSISQDEAEAKIAAAYAKTTPLLLKQTQQFQTQLNDQLALGVISEETYNRMSAGLKKVQADTNHLTKLQQLLSDGIAQSFASNAIQAFTTITDSIGKAIAGTGKWSDVLASVGQAFAQFAAGVLKDIAGILIKYEILLLLKTALGVGPGGAGAAHAGGIVGALTQSRSGINPAAWIGAPRAHGGGLAGLAYGEVPVIVQAGEEILTTSDPRHKNNYNPNAGSGSAPSSIRNVMLFDPNEVASSMTGAPGEKVTLTHIKRNAPAIRQLLGVR